MDAIMLLCVGAVLGAQTMNLMHAYWGVRDATRSATEAATAAKRTAGDHFLRSLELYQVQQRYGLVP